MTSPTSSCQVLVLGAGLTGMSAALQLESSGADYLLLEREAVAGGHAVTVEEQGYRFDRTGHLLHLKDDRRRNRILQLLDEPPLEIHRQSLVYSERVFTRYPYQSNTFGLPRDVAYECVLGFLRAKMHPATAKPRNFEEFCRIHFGDPIAERFMLPYNGRLWGVAPREVTTEWCERFVPQPELEDVLAGAFGVKTRELGYNVVGYYPRRGIGELSAALERRLRRIHRSVIPRRIDPVRRTCSLDDGTITYDRLISTLPLPALLSLIDDLPQTVLAATKNLRCSALYYLDVALHRQPRLPFHWIYVPEERFPFYRVGNYAAFSADMAPAGAANLYVELVEREMPQLDRLWPRVLAGLEEMGIIESPDDVAFHRLRHLSHAYVIYDDRRSPSLDVIQRYLTSVGIITTGRYGGWNYSSMEDALRFGEEAVALVSSAQP
ncbi:MAG: FAD-dependent oxidoreductase [Polyangiaceae bacterium]